MVDQVNSSGAVVGDGATDGSPPPAPATFSEAEVTARIAAATSTTQSQLAISLRELETSNSRTQELDAENTRLTARNTTLQKTTTFADDADAFSSWMAGEEQRIKEVKAGLGTRAMEVTRAEMANTYAVPKALLLGATTETDMFRIALEYSRDNPAVSAAAATPSVVASVMPDPAAVAPPVTPTPAIDRGGAGNVGGGQPAKGTEKIGLGLRDDPAWAAFWNRYPDAS